MATGDIRPGTIPKLVIYGIVLAVLWFVPPPAGVEPAGWRVLVVFAATIFSFILRPLPMGPMVLLGLVLLAATNTLGATNKEAFRTALGGFGDSTVWLVVSALLISGAVIQTGLGRRIALTLISLLGRTTIGLGYAAAMAELILGPVVPSNTARGGGVMAPIMDSLSQALGSTPQRNPRAAGDYLMLCGAHVNLITAAMFLTGMAANPLVSKAALSILDVKLDWNRWLIGSIVPGLAGLALLPAFLYWLAPPQRKDSVEAQRTARDELRAMGNWSYGQIVTS
ncbi:MAG: anion permease, partial [Planctomycetota bacterium]|nr:anion permease [Planctomycetota bacterium]